MMLRTLWQEPDRFKTEYFERIPGCYSTSDAAVKDEDGHFRVVGRVDDVINVAGHRLSTLEMESAIMECDEVAEVAVVGMPHQLKGLVPAAFVTLRTGQEPNAVLEDKIRKRVSESISKIAAPEFVFFTDVLPKTPSGKILRRLLKEIVSSGEIGSDTTGLEDATAVDRVKSIVRRQTAAENR